MSKRIDILGVGFDAFTKEQALQHAQALMQSGRGGIVVTPNPEIVELCRADAAVMALINSADLVLADGVGITMAAKKLGTPLPERLPGIEFASALCSALAARGGRLFLLGAAPGVASLAGEKLQAAHPGLVIAGSRDGFFSAEEEEAVAIEVQKSAADAVFVCLGAPKQERFMHAHRARLAPALLLGLGGSLDVFSGTVKRAPAVFSKLGLEWFYRLCKNPSRLKRMMKLPAFLRAVRARQRQQKKEEGAA